MILSQIDEYDRKDLISAVDAIYDAINTMSEDMSCALDRLDCLEKLDAIKFIRDDITYIRQAVGSSNSCKVHIENAMNKINKVLNNEE